MTKKQTYKTLISTNIFLFGLLGCGGTTGQLTPETTPEEVNTEETFNMSELPSLDVSKYDYSLESNSTTGASGSLLSRGQLLHAQNESSPEGEFSRGGCELERVKRQVFADSAEVDTFMCYVKAVNQSDSSLVVPLKKWAYYDVNISVYEGAQAIPYRVRVGQFGTEFKMDACGPNGKEYKRGLEFRLNLKKDGSTGYVQKAGISVANDVTTLKMSYLDLNIEGTVKKGIRKMNISDYIFSQNSIGNVSMLNAKFESDVKNESNTIDGETETFFGNQDHHNLKFFGLWDSSQRASVQYQIAADETSPTESQCRAWGVSEDMIGLCVNQCYINGEGTQTQNPTNGKCVTDLKRTDSFVVKDSKTGRGFFGAPSDSNPYFETAQASQLSEGMKNPAEFTTFKSEWNCEAERDFINVDATKIPAVAACGTLQDLPEFTSCEEKIWSDRLAILSVSDES